MKASIFLTAFAAPLVLAVVYPITKVDDVLNCRDAPNTSGSIVRTYPGTGSVDITCQTYGESINGHNVWDKTVDNCFVSDWYVLTGTGQFVVPACDGTTQPPPPNPGGVKIPTHNCRQYVIDSGYKTLNQFPGAVHTVWCYANKSGEHGEGRALDFMVQPHSQSGYDIADWAMKNAADLKVMYIIWEQRIWNTQKGTPVIPWNQWEIMEDRGSCTQNHCDHVHISYVNA